MKTPDFARYLAAKRALDDRSLNAHVTGALRRELDRLSHPIEVLEIGAGIGSTVERMAREEALRGARYTAIDVDPACVAEARRRLASTPLPFSLELTAVDLETFAEKHDGKRSWDLLTAHAFMDLVDLERTVPQLVRLVRSGGLLLFTLTFDGVTVFEPVFEPDLDARIESAYHRTMDERRISGRRSGDSHSGRRLLTELRRCGASLLAAGASDWVVFAGSEGFDDDERYFLHTIVDTVATAVEGAIPADALQRWHEARRGQVDDDTLVFVAHQLDVLARR